MSKRKTPAQALEEFLSYYDECVLEYKYACDKVAEEDVVRQIRCTSSMQIRCT